jgi:hypothetical protein
MVLTPRQRARLLSDAPARLARNPTRQAPSRSCVRRTVPADGRRVRFDWSFFRPLEQRTGWRSDEDHGTRRVANNMIRDAAQEKPRDGVSMSTCEHEKICSPIGSGSDDSRSNHRTRGGEHDANRTNAPIMSSAHDRVRYACRRLNALGVSATTIEPQTLVCGRNKNLGPNMNGEKLPAHARRGGDGRFCGGLRTTV